MGAPDEVPRPTLGAHLLLAGAVFGRGEVDSNALTVLVLSGSALLI